jgi:DNA-directed RNA polymerase sigma subunit (sigma70/sigma32)
MADTIAMVVDMQKEVDSQASELLKEKWKAMKLMEQTRPESSEILAARYFIGKTFPEIGQEMFITERQAQRKEKEAIREFKRMSERNDPIEAW